MESFPDLRPRLHPCGLMLAARVTLPHFSVSAAISLPNSARRSRQRRAAEVTPLIRTSMRQIAARRGLHLRVVESRVDLLVELLTISANLILYPFPNSGTAAGLRRSRRDTQDG